MTSTQTLRGHPGASDVLDLALLWVAKARRRRLDSAASFYDEFFAEHDLVKYQRDARNAWRFGRVADGIASIGASPVPPTVVDVGCGLGLLARYLPESVRYVGLDLSPVTLEHARRLARHPRAEFVATSFPRLAAEDASADVAVCLEVLEHLEDDAAAVREIARVVRPGGHLFVSVPQTYYWPSYLSLIGHFRHYTAGSLAALLRQGGFEVVRRYPMLPLLWRVHHYLYIALRVWERARRVVRRDPSYSLYESRTYRLLARRVLAAAGRREHRDDPASTFVLARRIAGEA